MRVHIRWMIRRDLEPVLAIEAEVFEFPWDENAFVRCLRQRNCIGMVAHVNEDVRGYMVYELLKNRLHVLSLAVAREHQRQGIGRFMLDGIKDKLSKQRRSRILLEVRDSNLGAQLFFRANGFRAVSVLKDFYDGTPEDAYVFQYRVPVTAECEGA